MPQHFVFIEPRDPEIIAFFNCFRDTVGSKDSRKPVHVTLQGPRKRAPTVGQVEDWHQQLEGAPLFIGNPGMFENSNEAVVFLRVEHPRLRSLWYKRDFPVSKFGSNPHISVYRGSNQELAHNIFEFLKKVRVELLCWDFAITVYTAKQRPLFNWIAEYDSIENLIDRGKIQKGYFQILEEIVKESGGIAGGGKAKDEI